MPKTGLSTSVRGCATLVRRTCTGDQDSQILTFTETVTARSKRSPLSYNAVQRTFLQYQLYLKPSREPIDESERFRRLERENLIRLMNVFVEEVSGVVPTAFRSRYLSSDLFVTGCTRRHGDGNRLGTRGLRSRGGRVMTLGATCETRRLNDVTICIAG